MESLKRKFPQLRVLTNTVRTLSSTVLEMKREHVQSRHSTNPHVNTQQTLGGNGHHRHHSSDMSRHVHGGNSGSVNIGPSESGLHTGRDVLHNPGDVVDVEGNNDISNGNDGAFGSNDTGDDTFDGVVPVLHVGDNHLHGGNDTGAGGYSPRIPHVGDGLGSHPNNDRIGVSSIEEVGVSHGNGDNDVDVDLVNAAHNSRNSNNNDSNIQDLIQIDNDNNDHLDLAEFGRLHNNNSTRQQPPSIPTADDIIAPCLNVAPGIPRNPGANVQGMHSVVDNLRGVVTFPDTPT